MASEYNIDWQQGEDKMIDLVYRSGPVGSETPVDLTNYAFRMDIAGPTEGLVLTVLNDEEVTVDNAAGTNGVPDTNFEVTLTDQGEIKVTLSRALTLAGGVFYPHIASSTPVLNYSYDAFLRNKATNKQVKILFGKITITKSVTRWR